MEIDRKSYAHAKRNLLKKGVDFSRIYVNLIKDERKNHYVKSVRIRSFSCLRFPAFGLKTGRYSVSLRIQCKCGKIRNRKTPNTDTFYTVNSSQIETSPPVLYINSVRVTNHSCSFAEEEDTLFSTQDKEILSILEEELEGTANFSAINNTRLSGYFYSDNIFNLSRRVLTKMEIKMVLAMLLSKIRLTNRNLRKISRSFVVKCVLNGISAISLLQNLVLRLLLILNLRGNHLKAVLV